MLKLRKNKAPKLAASQEKFLSSLHKNTFAREDVVNHFRNFEPLFETERVLFAKLSPRLKDSKILDIGVGGGRTTRHLLEISSDYIGIDYVPQFAEETARKYPNTKICCGDATNLKDFDKDPFDFVLFSYNGIDYVPHSDRQVALDEAYRVLKPGGIFMFSSHNRDYKYFNKLPWHRDIEYTVSFLRFCTYCLYHLPKHYEMKKYEIHNDDYALVNDSDHRYSLLHYYISIDKQVEHLNDAGFINVEAYDKDGNLVESDRSSHWIYYLAHKP